LLCFKDLQEDPYDPDEADPMKCRAIESSLWELKVCFTWSLSRCLIRRWPELNLQF